MIFGGSPQRVVRRVPASCDHHARKIAEISDLLPVMMSIDDATRHQLVTLARRSHARDVAFHPSRPTEWRPWEVRHPGPFGGVFTDAGAWELVAANLEAGHAVEVVEL